MNFDKPVQAKRYFSGKSIALCVAGLIILLIPFIAPDIDEFGRMFSFVLAGLLFLMAIYNFLRNKKVSLDAKAYENPVTAPANVQLKYLKKLLIPCYFTFPVLIFTTAWELKELEMGKTESVELWLPLSFIYNHTGYWPTVLSVLFISIAAVIMLKWKINKLSVKQKTIQKISSK